MSRLHLESSLHGLLGRDWLLVLGCLAVLGEVDLERLNVLIEAQCAHRPQNIVSIDRFPLLLLALIARLAGDEGNEFRYALLNAFFRVLAHLGRYRKHSLHDPNIGSIIQRVYVQRKE